MSRGEFSIVWGLVDEHCVHREQGVAGLGDQVADNVDDGRVAAVVEEDGVLVEVLDLGDGLDSALEFALGDADVLHDGHLGAVDLLLADILSIQCILRSQFWIP